MAIPDHNIRLNQRDCNIAVVGCGYWGKNLVRNFAALGVLAAVSDTDSKCAARYARECNVKHLNWKEILADNRIEAVSIATPAVSHAELTLQALEHGKHVLIEKPMALDIQQAEMIVELAHMHDRIVMVGHLLQYHPAFLRLHKFMTEGTLGSLRYIYSNRLNFGRFRTEENILWSFAPHDISMILALTASEPRHIDAVGQSYLGPGIADSTITHLSFVSGVQAHIYVSWLHPFKEQKLVVIGEKGMAVFDDTQEWDTKLLLYPHVVEQDAGMPVAQRAKATAIPLQRLEPLREECLHFIKCITEGKTPRTDAAEGLRVLRVLTTAQQKLDRTLDEPAK